MNSFIMTEPKHVHILIEKHYISVCKICDKPYYELFDETCIYENIDFLR